MHRTTPTPTSLDALVFAVDHVSGGVKSLYGVCEALDQVGRCTIANYAGATIARWFRHDCRLYDYSYLPSVVLYPEVYQPHFPQIRHHVCLALGKYQPVLPHATLAVCKSPEVVSWVSETTPSVPTVIVPPSIDRARFEYDGRPKRDVICYMTRRHKHPEMAQLLRERYGEKVVEIVERREDTVADLLKEARVFVWRGNDKEGSPRPPKEALVAGCVVVGLEQDLNDRNFTDFGVRCSSVQELAKMAGEALRMPLPSVEERAKVRDKYDEARDWIALVEELTRRKTVEEMVGPVLARQGSNQQSRRAIIAQSTGKERQNGRTE